MPRSVTTLTDVAREAGVSLSTASLAFSGSGPIAERTRQRVLAAASTLGYRGPNAVAASLRRGRCGVVGVVMASAVRRSFRDPVSIQFLDGITTALAARDYGTLLVGSGGADGLPDRLVTHGAMDAAVVMAGAVGARATNASLRDRGIPRVHIGGTGRSNPSVRGKDREGMALMGRRLLARGHTRVAVATLPWQHGAPAGPLDLATSTRSSSPITSRRLAGLRDAGIEPVAAWNCSASLVEEGIAATEHLMAAKPTALVGFSDLIAAGLLLGARERGVRVPQDVAVVGFDGIDLPWLGEDRLTTVAQPITEMGARAAQIALALAHGEEAGSSILDVSLSIGTTD